MSEQHEAESHAACWYVAGPMQRAGLDVERDGNVLTIWIDGVAYSVTVTRKVAPRSFDSMALWLRAVAG